MRQSYDIFAIWQREWEKIFEGGGRVWNVKCTITVYDNYDNCDNYDNMTIWQ